MVFNARKQKLIRIGNRAKVQKIRAKGFTVGNIPLKTKADVRRKLKKLRGPKFKKETSAVRSVQLTASTENKRRSIKAGDKFFLIAAKIKKGF